MSRNKLPESITTMQFEYHKKENSNEIERLAIVCENSKETLRTAKHLRLFDLDTPAGILECAKMLRLASQVGKSCRFPVNLDPERPWFNIEGTLEAKYTDAYLRLLSHLTGYKGELPRIDLTNYHPNRLSHTHITEWCGIVNEVYQYSVLIQSQDWNGKSAEERAKEMARDYAEETIGYRPTNPEFIRRDNGRLVKNPDYLKRRRVEPVACHNWLWLPLWNWWAETYATPGQKDFIRRKKEEVAKNPGPGASFGWEVSEWPPTGGAMSSYLYLNNYREQYTWEEFRNM